VAARREGTELEDRRRRRDLIALKHPAVFKGYLFDNNGTARRWQDGWLHTGDVVELAPNGELMIVDRKKAIIITSGGKNIAPSEIENALKDSPTCAKPSCSATAASSCRR
jgi:long-subunit acyl-CoA synthetase (AMP-forming)